ncbi:MAG: hypothetical protein WCX15_02155 [Bacilli bacterium]|jgi:hypothetical protein
MSIQEKLGNISKKIENKKSEKQISQKKISYSDLIEEKKSVVKKIEVLIGLYSNLKELYSSSGSDIKKIKEFKTKVKEVEDYFSENEDELLLINIESVEDLLSTPDLKDDQESKDIFKYQKDGFARNKGEKIGDKLREKVSQLSETKVRIKEELPDEELKFTGGIDSDGLNPRKESLDKIKEHIDYLSNTKVRELDNEIIETRKEILPVLKKMIKERVDEIFLDEDFIRSIEKKDLNYQFIPDKILKICNNDLWSDVKNFFTEAMHNKKDEISKDEKKFSEYKDIFEGSTIKDNLNAEKLVFDVKELKNNNKDLIKAIIDKENFIVFNNNFFNEVRRLLSGDGVLIKDNKVFRKDSIINKEYFDSKNEEAKIVLEEVRENILKILDDLNNELKIKFFDGKDVKDNLTEYKKYLSEEIDKINKIDSNEKLFQKDKYSLLNKISNLMSELDGCSSLKGSRLNKIEEARKKIKEEFKKFQDIFNEAREKYSKFLSDNYDLNSFNYEIDNSFGISYYNFENKLKKLFPENNISSINEFIANLEGKSFSYEEINKVFSEEEGRLDEVVKEYPNNKEVMAKFTELLGNIKDWRTYEMFVSKLAIKDPEKALKAKNDASYKIRNFFS